MSDDANKPPVAPVIQLTTGQTRTTRSSDRYCWHNQYVVDEQTLEVSCGGCGREMVAGEVLLEYARRERSWQWHTQEVRDAERRVAELKAEERKIKARIKNANRKDASVAVAEEQARTERMRHETIRAAQEVTVIAQRIEKLARRGSA